MSEPKKAHFQTRDRYTGQFAYDGNMDRMCRCGHTLGIHAEGGFDCLAGTGADDTPLGQFCECLKFRPVRKRARQ